MAEFLSQDEIDALLDAAEDYEDTVETDRYNKINEIITFSEKLADSIHCKNRVQSIVECSKIINYVDSILKEYNLNIRDITSYNYKSKENEFCVEMPRSSGKSTYMGDVKLGYSLKELEDPKIFQQSLDILNRLGVDIITGEVK